MLNKAELLLPAGSLTKLKTAILYGADAVYAGTPDMCLRAQSKMTLEDLEEGIKFVHDHGKKIYLTLNLFMHNRDTAKLPQFVDTLRRLHPDGVLIADPGVFQYVKDHAPELNLFVSTQANICSALAVQFFFPKQLLIVHKKPSFSFKTSSYSIAHFPPIVIRIFPFQGKLFTLNPPA